MKPNLFIVGKPKSGTTALYQFLEQHPQVFMSESKEPNYFCLDLGLESRNYHGHKSKLPRKWFPCQNLNEYEQLFENSNENHKIIGEASTHYIGSSVAPIEIHKYNPDAKIIIMLREPAEFLYSYYIQGVWAGVETAKTFEQALSLENARRKGKSIPKTAPCPSDLYYSEQTEYTKHITNYLEVFQPENIKILVMEEFKQNNHKTFTNVCEWLGIGSDFKPNFELVNANKQLRYVRLKLLADKSQIWPSIRKVLPRKYRSRIRNTFYNFVETKSPQKLHPSLKQSLMKSYYKEVQKLTELTGTNFLEIWHYEKQK